LKDLAHLLGEINKRQGLQMRAIVFANTTHVRCSDVHRPGRKGDPRLTHTLSFCVITLLKSCVVPITVSVRNVAIFMPSLLSHCPLAVVTPVLLRSSRFPPGYSSAIAAYLPPSAHAAPGRHRGRLTNLIPH